MSLPCGCGDHVVVADPARHAAWHGEIAPLKTASAAEIWARSGMVVPPERTYIDDQFDEARGIARKAVAVS